MLLERARIIAHIDRLLGVDGKRRHLNDANGGKYYLKNYGGSEGKEYSEGKFKGFRFWLRVEEHGGELDVDGNGERADSAAARNEATRVLAEKLARDIDVKKATPPSALPSHSPAIVAAVDAVMVAHAVAAAAGGGRRRTERRGSSSKR